MIRRPITIERSKVHSRRTAQAGLVLSFAVLAYGLIMFGVAADGAVRFPYGLDYGEGIIWQQMRDIVSGRGYGPIDRVPAIVFHYPPLYHLTVGALAAATGTDELAAGRLVSIAATFGCAGVAAAIVAHVTKADAGTAASRICGAVTGLIFLSSPSVIGWSNLMRVDMLALALSFTGFYFGVRALTRSGFVVPAALCFVAAAYTKQSMIAGPIVVFSCLLFMRPRVGLMGIMVAVGTGMAAMAILQGWTGGGFIRHIFLYNLNRIEPHRFLYVIGLLQDHALYLVAAGIGASYRFRTCPAVWKDLEGVGDLRRRLTDAPAEAAFAMVIMYALLSTLMLGMIVKSGSSFNYYLEWICVLSLVTGLAMRDGANIAVGPERASAIIPRTLPLAVAAQALLLSVGTAYILNVPPQRLDELRTLVELIRTSSKPVISDEMVAVLRGGKAVVWEPAIFRELASTGAWDQRPFIKRIDERAFGFFVTSSDHGDPAFNSLYDPAIGTAIRTAYPIRRRLAGYTLHFPNDGPRGRGADR